MASKKISELSDLPNPSLAGVTVVVDGGSTYKTTLNDLKNTLVDGLSHHFTGSQNFSGSLLIEGDSVFSGSFMLSGSHKINGDLIITGKSVNGSNPKLFINNIDSGSIAELGVRSGGYFKITGPYEHGSSSINMTSHEKSVIGITSTSGSIIELTTENFEANLRIYGDQNSIGTVIQDFSPITEDWSDVIVLGNYNNWNDGLIKIKRTIGVSGSLDVTGSVTASYFVGDGSQLVNLPIPVFTHFATTGSNNFIGDQFVSGTMSSSYFKGDGSQLTNLPVPIITNLATTGSNRFIGNQVITGSLSNGSSSFNIGLGSHAEGVDTYAYGPFSHTEGSATFTSTLYSNILNVNVANNIIEVYSGSNFQVGHDIAYVYNAGGNGNKVWRGVVAGKNDNFITASGAPLQNVNSSVFWGLHPDGSTLFNLSSGSNQSGLGYNAVTGSIFAHAEGSFNLAAGLNSHAEGRKNAAIGNHTHVEGSNTLARGVASHAEGIGSISNGYGSHAEGFYTITSGNNSHAEGFNTEAKGDYSHTEGNYTISSGSFQHVQGKYNLPVPYESAFVIGNGDVINKSNLVCAYDSQFEITGSLIVTGSVTINDMLVIVSQSVLPNTAPSGAIMTSGSGVDFKPYFYNGTTWTSLI